MTLQEAAAQHLASTVRIVWMTDDQRRRTSLYHVEVETGRTVCGRDTAGSSGVTYSWSYLTYSLPALAQRVRQGDLCSECRRLLEFYDFAVGPEPSRIKEPL